MLNASGCVVLNASYEPLDIISSKDALIMCLKDKAVPLQHHDYVVRSPSIEIPLPSTIALKTYVRSKRVLTKKATLTQRNLFTRDSHRCQYCGRYSSELGADEHLSRDHVLPRAKGGEDIWLNVVACCSTCNNKKGDFTLEEVGFELINEPSIPTIFELFAKNKLMREFSMKSLYEQVI